MVRFIPRYLIFLVAISNGIFSLISVSDISLLVYKNVFDFWILTLYPAVLPNSFIRLSSFLVESVGFSMLLSCHLQAMTVLLPLFKFGCLLLLFLIWLLWLGLSILCWVEVVKMDILPKKVRLEEVTFPSAMRVQIFSFLSNFFWIFVRQEKMAFWFCFYLYYFIISKVLHLLYFKSHIYFHIYEFYCISVTCFSIGLAGVSGWFIKLFIYCGNVFFFL